MQANKGIFMFAIGLVMVCIVFGAFGQVSMKKGMTQMNRIDSLPDLLNGDTLLGLVQNSYVVLGLALYFISAFLWLGALSTLDVSFTYPLLSLGYVVTAVFAFVYIGESISLFRAAGIALIVIGCLLISRT
jgi:multidrug transporter EmrE-like cation transporter